MWPTSVDVAILVVDHGLVGHEVEPLLQVGNGLLRAGQGGIIEVELAVGLQAWIDWRRASILASWVSRVAFCVRRFSSWLCTTRSSAASS